MKVMFVGGAVSQVGDLVEFTRFGQLAELDSEQVMNAARGSCTIIPVDGPAARAFTAEELKLYASFGSHAYAPAEFRDKVKAARIAAAAFAEEVEVAYAQWHAEQRPKRADVSTYGDLANSLVREVDGRGEVYVRAILDDQKSDGGEAK